MSGFQVTIEHAGGGRVTSMPQSNLAAACSDAESRWLKTHGAAAGRISLAVRSGTHLLATALLPPKTNRVVVKYPDGRKVSGTAATTITHTLWTVRAGGPW